MNKCSRSLSVSIRPLAMRSRDMSRWRAATPLLQPGVPGRAYVGALGDLLAEQPRSSPTRGRQAERRRIEPDAAVAEERSKRIGGHERDPVYNYTMIRSLL